MDLLLAAGAVGLAGYALGKRKERREIANGYVTYHGNGQGHLHYGKTNNHQGGRHQHQTQTYQTGYYGTTGQY